MIFYDIQSLTASRDVTYICDTDFHLRPLCISCCFRFINHHLNSAMSLQLGHLLKAKPKPFAASKPMDKLTNRNVNTTANDKLKYF